MVPETLEWGESSLFELADYVNGRPTKPSEVQSDGVPVIKIAELNRGITASTNRVSASVVAEKHWVVEGDLLFAWSGSIGVHTYRGERAALNQHIFRVVARPGIDQVFVKYLLLSQTSTFASFVADKQTTMGHVTVRDLQSTTVALPTLPEQRAIANILGTLDDKIELNRRVNETLEAMARVIFKSWFVDFDPVRAKAEGRDPGLPEHIADLFPDRFEDSELGEIPAGWKVDTLGDLSQKPQYGYTASANSEPVGPKFLRIADINKRDWIDWTSVPFCKISAEDYEKYKTQVGDILIARMADPGHGVMIEEEIDAVLASYLIRFKPRDSEYSRYIQYWLRSEAYWELVTSRSSGTTRANLNAKVLSAFPLVFPSRTVISAFREVVDYLRSKVVANVNQSRTLAAIRDALLPLLVSGELRVVEAKAFVEDTA